jgi:PAS domain S-box-containing protein
MSLDGTSGDPSRLASRRSLSEGRPLVTDPATIDLSYFQQMIEAITEYEVIRLDLDGRICTWHPGAERLTGYRADEILGRPVTAFYTVEDIASGLAERELETAAVQGRFETEGWRVRKDGSTFWASVVLSPIRDATGAVRGYVKITRDLTERKLADAALAERTRELEISNRDLLEFASVASHDLQEPLRKVASFCQLLARQYQGQLDEEADEYIGFVVDGAIRMQQLINDLLALARVGRSGAKRTGVDCGKVMQQVRMELAPVIEQAGADLVAAVDLPVVCAHQGLIAELFSNLVANAIKFRRDEPPRIEVWATREAGEWRFAVADNGIGIEAQYADRVFAVFERLHSRSEYPGTGIGLALCRKIVELHRGRIWFESEPGAGTTFYWTMPAGEQL